LHIPYWIEIKDPPLLSPFLLRGGPLEIPGGGVKIPPKKFMENEKCLEKNSRSHYVREKIIVQANSKVQTVLEKNYCRG
jgi:hypothetical protein